MFCLNVALGNTSWRLLFRDEEKAQEAFSIFVKRYAPQFTVVDDFGQTLVAQAESVHGAMLEDMDKTKMAHVEMALHQARTQNLATKMAQTDPSLKTPAMGPSVLNPMGNGFAGRN